MTNRYTLYGHWMSGPTYKVALMLSLSGAPFNYVHVDIRAGEQKKPEFIAKNRYGQVPCLADGDANLCQSASILQYLADSLGKFGGHTPLERARIREWMYWDFDRLAPSIYRSRAIRLGIRQADSSVVTMYTNEGQLALSFLNAEFGKHAWATGDHPTIADIDLYGVINYAADGGFALSDYPNLSAWKAKFEELPGFKPADALLPKQSQAA